MAEDKTENRGASLWGTLRSLMTNVSGGSVTLDVYSESDSDEESVHNSRSGEPLTPPPSEELSQKSSGTDDESSDDNSHQSNHSPTPSQRPEDHAGDEPDHESAVTSASSKSSEHTEQGLKTEAIKAHAKVLLRQLRHDLRGKVSKKHHSDINAFSKAVETRFAAMLENLTPESIEDFRVWCGKEIANTRDTFKADFSFWHDVLRPTLVGFLGVLLALVTSPVLPFSKSTRDYVNSYFQKPLREEQRDKEVFDSYVANAKADLLALVSNTQEKVAEEEVNASSQVDSNFGV